MQNKEKVNIYLNKNHYYSLTFFKSFYKKFWSNLSLGSQIY